MNIRWMLRSDLPRVLEIESQLFEFPWFEEDIVELLRQRNCIAMVAERGDRILGYVFYTLCDGYLDLLNLAVCPDFRRQGVATQIVNKLTLKLSLQRRTSLVVTVRDSNLDAQLFFKEKGFKAIDIIKEPYEGTDDDAYVMEYKTEEPANVG